MKLITTTIICFLSIFSFGQECNFLPSDTVVCGFKHNFLITESAGTFHYECEDNKNISITNILNGSAMFAFSKCGEYKVIFESSVDNCLDTFRIQINDPSTSMTSIETLVTLGYGDIDCPDDVVADCFSDDVSISLSTGTPEEVWSFCTIASCQSTFYTTEVSGEFEGCLVDTITCDTTIIIDSSDECIETNQDAFILLNSDGDMVDNNTFLEYIAQLQASLDLDCNPVIDSCYFENEESCIDSTVIDTSYLHIPVRIGGKWTLANIDSVELFDTTYFEFLGIDYELILDPGVDFYGPGNLDVYLNEIVISSNNDTIKNFPYGFQLELQWEEEWIIDTLQLIKEISIDTTGDCIACGGNFFNSGFNVPGIPDFPCGPVSIDYPDICDCEIANPDFSVELINCDPKEWQLDIFGGIFEIIDVIGAQFVPGSNSTILFAPSLENVTVILVDYNGCEYYINIYLEYIVEEVRIETSGESELSCENSLVQLEAVALSAIGQELEFDEAPIWRLPNGGVESGFSISASEAGYYSLEYEDESGCVHIDGIDVEYNDEVYVANEYLILCGDEGVDYYGVYIDQEGEYDVELDCNDIIHLSVSQIDIIEYSETYQVCQGESVNAFGENLGVGFHELIISNGSSCSDIAYIEVIEIVNNVSWDLTHTCDGSALLYIAHDADGADYSVSGIGDFSNNGNSLDVVIDNSGSYNVDVDISGCVSSFSVDVELMEYDILAIPNAELNCSNECAVLNPDIINLRGQASPSDYTIYWTGPNGFTSSDQSIEVCEGGEYIIQLQYGDNCQSQRSILVNEDFEPSTQYIDADLCYGECYDDGIYTFCQSTQTIIEVDDCNRVVVDVNIEEEISEERVFSICEGERIEINSIAYDQDGEYEAQFVSQSGCDSILYFSIDVMRRGEVTSDNIIDCKHDDALMRYNGFNDNEAYVWRDEEGLILSTDANYLANHAGIYTIEVTVMGNENECTFVEEFELFEDIVYPEIVLDESYTINCETSAIVDFNMDEGSSWTWMNESAEILFENEVLDTEDVGVYSVVVTNVEGCSRTESVEIFKAEPLEFDFSTVATCEDLNEGSLAVNNIKGGMAPYTLLLDGEEIGSTVSTLESREYKLSILQSDGCIHEQEVTVESIPDLDDIPIQNLEYCNDNGVKITLNLDDNISFKWLDEFDSNERLITKEGMYEVELSNGCNSIISAYHVEDIRVDEPFVVSNIFSPDANSVNDYMKIAPQVDFEDFKIYIFNRGGSLVYESTNPEDGWDGKIGGSNALLGTYVWMIDANVISCGGEFERIQKTGTVMVIY